MMSDDQKRKLNDFLGVKGPNKIYAQTDLWVKLW